jgi:hypothetical protein
MCSLERIAVEEDSLGALGRLERMLMCSLERSLKRIAGKPEQPAEEDTPGELNVRKAVQAYRVGGKDPWSIIACFAF